MKRIKLFFLMLAFAGMANATVYYVSSTGNNSTGDSWTNAFTSPAAAIASATPVSGSEFWVKQGTYTSAATLSWETGQSFYGGFVGTETLRSQRSTDATLTILEGNNTNRVLNAPSMASATTWDGFTIQKGTAATGAGAFLQKNAILSNCIFQNNTAANATTPFVAAGGGIYIQGLAADADSIKVLNCIVKNNIVKTIITTSVSSYSYCGGGGIYIKPGSIKAVVRGCTIESNTADGLGTANAIVSGGGIYMCDGIIDGCTIKNNVVTNANPTTFVVTIAKNQGGGIFVMPQASTNTVVQNSSISGNSAPTYVGGGIAIDPLYTSTVVTGKVAISNCYILNNSSRGAGGGVITAAGNLASTSEYSFNNCVIANNESSVVAAGGGGVFVNNLLGTNVAPTVNNSVNFANCTVVNNKMLTTNYGGAGIFYNNIKADITNCVFWGNGSVGTLVPYHVRVKTALTTNKLINCTFDSRFVELEVSPTGFATDLTGKVIVDVNNTGSTSGTLYPNFTSPTNFIGKAVTPDNITNLAAANWSITAASACVNAGATLGAVTTDITGLTRPQGGAYDIGAYELRAYTIAASSNNGTMGTVSGNGAIVSGATVSLVATPNSGYHFVNWTESGSPVTTNTTYSFTCGANRTFVANFEPNTVAVSSGSTNASTITCTTCDVTVASGAELAIDANKTFKSVTVAAGGKLTLNDTRVLIATNGITLQNTASGTASFVDSRTDISPSAIAGTVEQEITETNRNWYVAVPVSGRSATDITLTGAKIVQRNEAQSRWDDVTGSLTTGMGYIALASANAGTTTWTLSGNLNSGKVEIPVTRAGASSAGFNLLGNPYPSYLNWEQVLNLDATNESVLQSSIWYRTATYNSGSSKFDYTFNTYNSTGRIATPTSTTGNIPPMQAFWVRANSAGTVSFTNAMRSHGDGASNLLKAAKMNTQKIIRLQVSNDQNNTDETVVYFDVNAQNTLDNYDTQKMFNNLDNKPEIFTSIGNEQLVINGMNNVKYETEIPLGFSTGQAADFSITTTEMTNFEAGTRLIIKDNLQLNTEIELSEGASYHFSSAITTPASSRFSLLLRAPGIATEVDKTNKLNDAQVYVNVANQIVIYAPEKCNYKIYNALGQKQVENSINDSKTSINKVVGSGIYFVALTVNGLSKVEKVIIR